MNDFFEKIEVFKKEYSEKVDPIYLYPYFWDLLWRLKFQVLPPIYLLKEGSIKGKIYFYLLKVIPVYLVLCIFNNIVMNFIESEKGFSLDFTSTGFLILSVMMAIFFESRLKREFKGVNLTSFSDLGI